jgi:AAA domain
MALKPTKAKPEQSKLKIGLYGKAGTGKTLTALLIAEWLALQEKKRVLFINTEPGGTDFYTMAVKDRSPHPTEFDFDRIDTKQILEVRDYIPKIDTTTYGVLIIDSASHLWDSASGLYTGKLTSEGTYPIHAYAKIKKPFRQLMDNARAADLHYIVCGREQNEFERHSADNWEFKGTRMRAEKETGHEPDITIQMMQTRNVETKEFKISMYVEKDHSGLMQGKTIDWPTGETFKPWYELLKGVKHTPVQSIEEAIELDIASQAKEEEEREAERNNLYNSIRETMLRANTDAELKAAWSLTQGKKMKLGDELYEKLENIKDGEKIRIREAMASRKVVANG